MCKVKTRYKVNILVILEIMLLRGPITAIAVDGQLKNIGCARRATERVSDDGEGFLRTALYGVV